MRAAFLVGPRRLAIARSGSAVTTARASSTRTVPVGVAATPSSSAAIAGGGSAAAARALASSVRRSRSRSTTMPAVPGRVLDHDDPAVVADLGARQPEQHREIDRRHDLAAQAEHAREARRRQEHARDRLHRQRLADVADRQRELLPAQLEAHEPQRSDPAGRRPPSAGRLPDVEVFLLVLGAATVAEPRRACSARRSRAASPPVSHSAYSLPTIGAIMKPWPTKPHARKKSGWSGAGPRIGLPSGD